MQANDFKTDHSYTHFSGNTFKCFKSEKFTFLIDKDSRIFVWDKQFRVFYEHSLFKKTVQLFDWDITELLPEDHNAT